MNSQVSPIPGPARLREARVPAVLSRPRASRRVATATGYLCGLLLFGVASCTVGPDFQHPAAPAVSGYTSPPLPPTTAAAPTAAGTAQRLVEGRDIPGEWWTLFHSPALTALVERSLRNNPSLKAAQAALEVARETTLAQRGAYYPSVGAGLSATRQKTSSELSPTPNSGALYFSLYTPQVSVSYMPDIFGLNRRSVEALEAQADQARFALAATHITLSANVVAAAIQEAALRGQLAATRQLLGLGTNVLAVLRLQLAKGYVSGLEVAAQEAQLAQVRATLPPLLKQLAQQRDLLAALSGGFPGQGLPERFDLADLRLPPELPLSLPGQLIEQRPDVRLAEANLHSACAQVGIAAANRLPNLTLTADAGTMALAAGQMFSGGPGFWTLAGSLTQPVFAGGMLRHRERAARAAYSQAVAQYRGVVLTAFQNVADSLHAIHQDADGLQAAVAAQQAAQTSLDLTRRQFQAGYTTSLAVLSAEQADQQAVLNLVQAQANRYADTAALFQALGGGWWHRPELTPTDAPSAPSAAPASPSLHATAHP